jgi:hypothetical protein
MGFLLGCVVAARSGVLCGWSSMVLVARWTSFITCTFCRQLKLVLERRGDNSIATLSLNITHVHS